MNIPKISLEDYEIEEIISVEDWGVAQTYDIEVKEVHCFYAREREGNIESISHNSATICLFSATDTEMMKAKTGNWYYANPQRARSNNSVLLIRDKTTREEFAEIMNSVKQFGEPGFIFSDSEDLIYNPCVEIGMRPQTEDGRSGWQGCNLTEINGGKCNSKEEFLRACKASAIIGTIQAAYTDFKYVNPISKEIFEREALLGCSITGFTNNPKILFDVDILREGAELIKKINKEMATILRINAAARTTCVKPSGNACTSFETRIKTSNGIMTLEEVFNYCLGVEINPNGLMPETWISPKKPLQVYDENDNLQDITNLYVNGIAEVYEIEFEDGAKYKFTENHKLKTKDGWRLVKDLKDDDEIISF